MDIEKRINKIFPDLVKIRRDFHKYPELSEQEYRTCNKISNYLEEWGIEHIKGIAETGVVAIIRGKEKGRTVGARADIDALPIQELNNLPYKSKNPGVMHACGHDIHTTIHLGVAKVLKEMEDKIRGNIKIFFQPAEETVGGAKRMIEEGYLENPKVEYILALHVMPYLEVGQIELKSGKMNAATDEINIKVIGYSSHGAYPEKSVDSIMVAGYIITALQAFISRNISPLNPAVITLGQIRGGVKNNVIADKVVMSGTLRTLDPETRIFAKNRIKEIAENIGKAYNAKIEVDFKEGYPALINNHEVVEILMKTGKGILGEDKVLYKEFPSLGADDFAYFLERTKGAYYNLGCGNKDKGWTAPVHSSNFIADEECIKIGVLLQTKALLNLLEI